MADDQLPVLPAIGHHFVGRGYSKVFEIVRGTTIGQHAHLKDHHGILAMGRVVVETDTIRGEISAPRIIHIPAGIAHEICAVEDSLWICAWADAEGAISPDEFDAKVAP